MESRTDGRNFSAKKPKYVHRLQQVSPLAAEEIARIDPVTETFAFRANDYYLSLIDWDDLNDPIKRLIIPDAEELNGQGQLDASGESNYTVVKGLEYKYDSTVIQLVNETCGGFCRFCFRKRLFMDDNNEVTKDISEAVKYIQAHSEITNVLLTGGDPMIMSTAKLGNIIRQIREIEHVQIIRIGTKMPAFNPFRIIDDPTLPEMIAKYTTPEKKIYIMAHFNHPRELTAEAVQGLNLLQKAGAMILHQTPLIKGINDDPIILNELFKKLTYIGVSPYYVFQCRPTLGNKTYMLPLEKAYEIFEMARVKCSGLAKRARFAMSHATGKIEMVGLTRDQVFFKYHRAAKNSDSGRFLAFKRNPEAYWLDDYDRSASEQSLDVPLSSLACREWVDWGLMEKGSCPVAD
jgi:KamA family protein